MQTLREYITWCYNSKGDNEICVVHEFSSEAFNNLRSDGLMFCSTRPPKLPNMEFVSVGESGYIVRKAPRTISWYDEATETSNFDISNDPLWHRLDPNIYGAESVNHPQIIKWVLTEYREQLQKLGQPNPLCYIEYGVRSGTCMKEVMQVVDVAFGVDMNDMPDFGSPKVICVKMMTTEFGQSILPFLNPNAVFIDADHTRESVCSDFDDVFSYLTPGGYIFLHDSHPCKDWLLDVRFCNNCFMANIDIKARYGDKIEFLILPLNPGLTIIRKLCD